MKYLAVLGRQPEISMAELESLFLNVKKMRGGLAIFETELIGGVDRLGGVLKLAISLECKPLEYLQKLPEGKITIGVSDYSKKATRKTAVTEALKLKKILVRHGRSVRVVENKEAVLSTATSLHNGLSGKNERKVELIKVDNDWYRVVGVQDIDAYAKRDQQRPARDARVGMLPPKLAQILINLCGPLKPGSTVLDPFCGTGVVLQEALLMGYRAYGTDINERMIVYSERNLHWLDDKYCFLGHFGGYDRELGREPRDDGSERPVSQETCIYSLSQGDATSFHWKQPIDAVACEGYLGKPMTQVPTEMTMKEQKQECGAIAVGFLKNLADQIESGTPVTIALPAWLRENGEYSRLDIVDKIAELGYNVDNRTREGLLYHREGQIVARDILILRKK